MRKPSLALIAAFGLVVGCTVYAVAAGARLGAPLVFLGLAAATLALSLMLLARSGMSLLREPPAEQVRVATGRRRKELEREKQSLLKALKELQFDHEMHKISDGDYQEIASLYRARATRVMRQLDENDAAQKTVETVQTGETGSLAPSNSAASNAQANGKPAAASRAAPSPSSSTCGKCGTANDADADFCKRCASSLRAAEATS